MDMGYEKGDMGNEKRETRCELRARRLEPDTQITYTFRFLSYPISHISLLVSLPA